MWLVSDFTSPLRYQLLVAPSLRDGTLTALHGHRHVRREEIGEPTPSQSSSCRENMIGTLGSIIAMRATSPVEISSLPVVGAGSVAGPVNITYNASTTCPIPASTGIAYGPAAVSGHRCTFNVLYDVNYSYSVTQGTGTACSIEYPPSISGLFVYNQITPSRVHSTHTSRT
jgi:hypothetical protein